MTALDRLDRDGFAVVPDRLGPHDVARTLAALGESEIHRAERKDAVFGARNLLSLSAIRDLAAGLADLVEPALGQNAHPVRALFFDKTAEANWPVLWHQDLTIAVDRRLDLEGFGPWSVKAGVVHVEPPVEVLQSMLAVRLHLDDSHEDNGPLRVLPGTHAMGRLRRDRITELRAEIAEHTCVAPVGSALLMRPLLLHASSPARVPSHRRVVHIEFAAADILPAPLDWAFFPGTAGILPALSS
jgi:ectoine hydroxylase-related dioxygenase (phytanoyl-CoA dioxygenase family)